MQRIVIVANGAPYGGESSFNSLRPAIALQEQENNLDLCLFLMSDAVIAGLRGQKPGEGYNIQQMLEILTAQSVPMKLCKTCTDRHGINTLSLVDGVEIGTLVELARQTLSVDKVLIFQCLRERLMPHYEESLLKRIPAVTHHPGNSPPTVFLPIPAVHSAHRPASPI